MNVDELQRKLFAAARSIAPSDAVPYAFEKRIMAHLTLQTPCDVWALWSRLLWRAAAPCVGITLILSVWTAVSAHTANPSSFAADLERTVWGPLTSLNESW